MPRKYAVTRRIVMPPRSGTRFVSFTDVQIVVDAPSGAVAARLADDVKAAKDWTGTAPLNPMSAWA